MKQAAEMSLNFIDLAFFGTPQAADALLSPTVCTGCQMGEWKFKSKNLGTLRH